MKHNLAEIAARFPIEGRFIDARPYGSGHINDTYMTRWEIGGKVAPSLQQRINHLIFKQPLQLMDNILRVTRHLQNKLAGMPGADPARETLTVVPARNGQSCHIDEVGNYWRTYIFIERATTYDVCKDPEQAMNAARAFGRFQRLLVDLPGGPLHETIPYFHHTPRRFLTLEEAIEKDAFDRAATARKEIEFALQRKKMTSIITDLLEAGRMPSRITHNDTKLNNVMIDDDTGRAVCVIDLDTVMDGSALYDFGDMVRTCTRTSSEDETDLSRVNFRMDIFESLARGYREEATFLTPAEVDLMAFAGALITFTIGIRFLADYLMGDVYFKTHRPGHNLDRTRVQFKMVENMEVREKDMQTVVRRYTGRRA